MRPNTFKGRRKKRSFWKDCIPAFYLLAFLFSHCRKRFCWERLDSSNNKRTPVAAAACVKWSRKVRKRQSASFSCWNDARLPFERFFFFLPLPSSINWWCWLTIVKSWQGAVSNRGTAVAIVNKLPTNENRTTTTKTKSEPLPRVKELTQVVRRCKLISFSSLAFHSDADTLS